MALSFDLTTNKSISFEEFNHFVKQTLVPDDVDTLLACTEALQMLSNNETFVTDLIHNELTDAKSFQINNGYTAQSIMLFSCPSYYVRLNLWPPSSPREDIRKWQDLLYFYERAHDHNFDFLTVGYFGSGYGTEMWEYDYESTAGYVGEKIDMTFLERTRLPKGKAMLYRASRDIHSQFAPEDYSVSINIISSQQQIIVKREQYFFDLEKKELIGTTANGGTGRYLMLNLAAMFGNGKTVNILEGIADKHEIPYVRLKAYDALFTLTNERETVWGKALNDRSMVVSEHAKLFLNAKVKSTNKSMFKFL
jgi:hypothetical protein